MTTVQVQPNVQKQKKAVHILPKRPGQSGHTEVHCFESVNGEPETCILVHVPSRSTLISELSATNGNARSLSDESLRAYAEKAKSSLSRTLVARSNEKSHDSYENTKYINIYDKYADIFNEANDEKNEYLWLQKETQAEETTKPVLDCSEFLDTITFVKDMVKNICEEGEVKAELEWTTLVESSLEKQESDKHDAEEKLLLDINEDDENYYDRDNNNYHNSDVNNYYLDDNFEAFRNSIEYAVVETHKSITSWPTIAAFNVQLGAYKIDEYLGNFETEEDWMYVIYYKGQDYAKCSDLHKYQAIYSLPTWKYPIAQATASIFFTIEVCKAKPPKCLVDVTFRYETFRQKYRAADQELQEKWLQYILDSKIKFFQTITY